MCLRIIYCKDRHTHQEEGEMIDHYDAQSKKYRTINIKSKIKPTFNQIAYLRKMIEENVPGIPSMDEVFSAFRIAKEIDESIVASLNTCSDAF